jgi:hypothetical protein
MLEFILSLAVIAFAIFLIDRIPVFQHQKINTGTFKIIFLVKLIAGFLLYLIYTRYYTERATADIFRYFDDAEIMYQSLFNHPYDYLRMLTGYDSANADLQHYYDAMRNWYNTDMVFNDTRTMIRFSAFLKLFSLGTYYPHAIVMCFLSMCGLTALYRFFTSFIDGKETVLLVAVFLMPSTLIWTSGLIKEAFLMFSLGMLLNTIYNLIEKKSTTLLNYSQLIIFICCLFLIKPYIIFLLLPCVVGWLLLKHNANTKLLKMITVYFIYGCLVVFAAEFLFGKRIPKLLLDKQTEFFHVAERDNANSLIEIPKLTNSYSSLIVNSPNAIVNVVFRPFILEVKNPLMLLAAIENLLIVIALLFSVYYLVKSRFKVASYWILIAFFFCMTIFILTGLVTPILGAIVRYKVPALPFFLFVMINYLPEIRFGNTIQNLIRKK